MASSFSPTTITTTYDLSSQGTMEIGGCKLGGFKSGSITIEAETVENFSRDDGGWTNNAPGKRSATLEVTFLKKQDDCQEGIRSLILNDNFQNNGVAVTYKSYIGGFTGTFVLTNYSESQTDGGDAVECTANFSSFGAIKTTTGTQNQTS